MGKSKLIIGIVALSGAIALGILGIVLDDTEDGWARDQIKKVEESFASQLRSVQIDFARGISKKANQSAFAELKTNLESRMNDLDKALDRRPTEGRVTSQIGELNDALRAENETLRQELRALKAKLMPYGEEEPRVVGAEPVVIQ